MDKFLFVVISMALIGMIVGIIGSLFQNDVAFVIGAGLLVTGIVGLLIVGLNRE